VAPDLRPSFLAATGITCFTSPLSAPIFRRQRRPTLRVRYVASSSSAAYSSSLSLPPAENFARYAAREVRLYGTDRPDVPHAVPVRFPVRAAGLPAPLLDHDGAPPAERGYHHVNVPREHTHASTVAARRMRRQLPGAIVIP
jgi:hypothetical protein